MTRVHTDLPIGPPVAVVTETPEAVIELLDEARGKNRSFHPMQGYSKEPSVFVKLTQPGGRPLWINAYRVVLVEERPA